jgi:hypothetical protein
MEIRIVWQQPIPLVDGSKQSLIYVPRDTAAIPGRPGVYIFGRRYGDTVSPLYIGKAENLAKRIEQQMNNVRLMKGIENAPTGERILLLGELSLRPGQRVPRVLEVVENALIEFALTNEHEILNKQGTRTPFHTLTFEGNRSSRQVAPLRMNVRSG